MKRYLEDQIKEDLKRKMVFVGGPRQVGKTTLAKSLLKGEKSGYLNWDIATDRDDILQHKLPISRLWIFDEIHKYRKWRNYLKGIYDGKKSGQQVLVTGSARLDLYRFGGDSLQGRYHYLRLHPLSVAELELTTQKDFLTLLKLGGFPEPFLSGSEKEARRWSKEYRSRVVRDDIMSLESVQDLASIELLMTQLPQFVGSPLSVNSLSELLQISHKTVAKWIAILERIYAIFTVTPLGSPKIKAVKKARKHYHFDWSLVEEESFRFENLVGLHLLKWANFLEDTEGRDMELRYFRDVEGREVDFVVTEKNKPLLMVECKSSDRDISPSLKYLKSKFPAVRALQLSQSGKRAYVSKEGIEVVPALEFLKELV